MIPLTRKNTIIAVLIILSIAIAAIAMIAIKQRPNQDSTAAPFPQDGNRDGNQQQMSSAGATATTTSSLDKRPGGGGNPLLPVDEKQRIYKIEGSNQLIQLIPNDGKSLGSGFTVAYLGGAVVPPGASGTSSSENLANSADSDTDGLNDFDETNKYRTDPKNPDTDGDGHRDGEEIKNGFNPNGAGKLN